MCVCLPFLQQTFCRAIENFEIFFLGQFVKIVIIAYISYIKFNLSLLSQLGEIT